MDLEELTRLIRSADGLDLLFGKHRKELSDLRLGQARVFSGNGYPDADTGAFLDALQASTAGEQRAMAGSRSTALGNVRACIGSLSRKLHGFDLNEYLFQLAVRVREPGLIDQRSAGWCPMNAALIRFARTQPVQYVKFAIDLWKTKEETPFQGARVMHAPELSQSDCYGLQMECVDYLMMKSLMHTFFPQRKEAATSKQLADALGHCGFATSVLVNDRWDKFPRLLGNVQNAINARPNIAITMTAAAFPQGFHEGDSERRRIDKAAADPGRWARGLGASNPRHFTLITKLEHDPQTERISKLKIYTWGRSYSLSMSYATLYANLYDIVVARQKVSSVVDNAPNG